MFWCVLFTYMTLYDCTFLASSPNQVDVSFFWVRWRRAGECHCDGNFDPVGDKQRILTIPYFSPCFLSDSTSVVQGFAWVIMGVGIFAFCIYIYMCVCVRMQFECQATRFLDRTIEERIADEPSTGHCANMSRCIHRPYISSDTLFWCDTCVILCLFFFGKNMHPDMIYIDIRCNSVQ